MERIYTEHLLTLGFIDSSLNRAYKRLKEDLDTITSGKTRLDIFKVYSSIAEVLLWINATNEWHYINNKALYLSKDNIVKNGVGETCGLRHAFNLIKHDMRHINLFILQDSSIDSDSEDESNISSLFEEVCWINCPDATKKDYEKNVEYYRKYLKGKPVLQSINKSITFLNQMNNNIRFNNKED